MEKYYKRKSKFELSTKKREGDSSKQTRTKIKVDLPRSDYWTLLSASVDCITFVLKQGLNVPDEYDGSSNEVNFLELLKLVANYNEDLKSVVLKNGPEYLKLISPAIQKDIVSAAAFVTTSAIIRDLGGRLFSVLLDE